MSLVFTPLVTDSFTPDANPLNPAKWTQSSLAGVGPLQAVGGVCEAAALNVIAGSGEFRTDISFPNDQYVKITVPALASSNDFSLTIRGNLAETNEYFWEILNNGDGTAQWFLSLILAGVQSFLTIPASGPFALGDTYILAAVGTTLYGLRNNVVVWTVVDSSLSSGAVAISIDEVLVSTSEIQLSNFEAGLVSVSAAQNIPIPLPFTQRTTTAVALFACIHIALNAQKFTANATTLAALQLANTEMNLVYDSLIRQDIPNQQSTLVALISSAQSLIASLVGTLNGMTATGDAGIALAQLQSTAQHALSQVNNVVYDAGHVDE